MDSFRDVMRHVIMRLNCIPIPRGLGCLDTQSIPAPLPFEHAHDSWPWIFFHRLVKD